MTRRRRVSRQPKTEQSGITQLQIGVVAATAIIMVLTFIVMNQGAGRQQPAEPSSSSPAAEQGAVAGVDLSGIPSELTDTGDPALGTPDAPVTVVEYSDYQCTHCENFSRDTFPEIVRNYVEAGKVRYVHRDAALLGEESQWAAMAAHCAADQGHFWEYHELLFTKQSGVQQGTFSRNNLKTFAADLGLDTDMFNQCLDENKYAGKIVAETREAQQNGVKGTPSFFVNDQFIEGNQPTEIKEAIDKQLEESS